MIIQAIGLLDDLAKELNTYAMRVREWYGWHFPELAKMVQDNILYAKTLKMTSNPANSAKLDFSEVYEMIVIEFNSLALCYIEIANLICFAFMRYFDCFVYDSKVVLF
ncbi:hypothetical protein SAY87_016455 [Trapa incisa]|uniref:NOSIC domain-containing protein n=1 Tax=Trapa incisa TaxID=236973 RepID=A0AAN7QUD9_9MYRT|nr:hypothetical protein SAY87_016455 [Trapa incisa]